VLDKFVSLVRQSRPYGIHFVISVNQLNNLSNQVYSLFSERFALKLTDPGEYRAIVGGTVPEMRDVSGRGYTKVGRQPLTFQVAVPIDLRRGGTADAANEVQEVDAAKEVQELEHLALAMQDYIAQPGRHYAKPVRVDALPRAVLLKQLLARQHQLDLDATFLDRLEAITRQRWENSTNPTEADWLNVTIGVISGNRPRPLYMEAKRDGVHGMIAGGTGAGKSELLMTLIVGLALNYDPDILNFVLVDYKGGGAFQPFAALPHCVDMITNLNKAGVQRMFTAINAEMQRRQELNAQHNVKDIVEYRARGLHRSHKPYPHLFIIIDEYAEMITDNPDFRDELDRITRVGRSLGVSLILASQRPTGVSDQMRANIKFRICLRVEGVETSREMLRRSDAALLPSGMPGRGYLQVGNENIELMQVAYTGEKYEHANAPEGGEKPNFYDVVVQMAQRLAAGRNPLTPWPPALPPALTMSHPLLPDYIAPGARSLVTLGRTNTLAINPFVQQWLDGSGTWSGVDWQTTAMHAVVGLLDDPHNAQQRPLVVNFSQGHAILFGASGWGKTTFLRSMVVSLASTHSPDEFQAHVLDLGGSSLQMLDALPHVGTIITPDEQGYEERVQQLWRELNDLIDQRKKLFASASVSGFYDYNKHNPEQSEPAILVVLDNITEFIETFGDMGQRKNDDSNLLEAFVTLARQGKTYGVHFIITATRLNAISSKLYSLFTERFTLRLSDASEYSGIVGGQVAEVEEILGRGCTRVGRMPLAFQVALPPGTVDDQYQVQGEIPQIRAIGQRMQTYLANAAHAYREPLRIDALPTTSSYRHVLSASFGLGQNDATFLDELKVATAHAWERNATAEHADWLAVPLGITSGNRRRVLHLEATKDGVHGMVAGGTGSGKSELLMTWIVGLAMHYSPDILNFVLVDYKGGGAFKPFEQLPHCVDIVTNLNRAGVSRMFTAINAEIRRRQALNATTGTKDIVEYRKKGWHKKLEAYPHLFIIIDEYAEMIDDNPEYRAELDSITRVGRAQGVNLVLASQKPKGVSDQMRANIKLRLCLRVEQMDTSQEMLRRPDAALLPSGMPGRGYLQVGNENIELIQVSYTGEKQPDDRAARVEWPERTTADAGQTTGEVPRLYDMAVKLTTELQGKQPVARPWPSFLPRHISLQSLVNDSKHNHSFALEPAVTDWLNGDITGLWPAVDWQGDVLSPVVGLIDQPSEAAQYPLRIDLRHNHLAVFGDAGFGKTMLLRTLLVSLMATYSPAAFQAYILDLGGRNMRSLEAFPHVGSVVYADEEAFEERLQRLLDRLTRMTEERQQRISEGDVSTIYEFNAHYPDQAFPAVLLVIDNYAELQENYTTLVETTLLPLLRRSLAMGITCAVACNTPSSIVSKVYSLFSERLTFKQTNFDRYLDIVGRGAVEIDDVPGLGYIRRGRQPLLFQAAQPVGIFQEDGRDTLLAAEEVRLMASRMQQHITTSSLSYTPPDPIGILPRYVALEELIQAMPASASRIEGVIGQNAELNAAAFNLKRQGAHFVVAGPPLSGKTTVLYNWALSLASRYSPAQVKLVLIDMQRKFFEYGGQHQLDELPHVVATISEAEQVQELIQHLKHEGDLLTAQSDTRYEVFVLIDNFDEFSDEISRDRSANMVGELAALARRYGRNGLHFVIAGTLDGNRTDFQRRIQASNLGIGLRTDQPMTALGVTRIPAAVRNGELPPGRGYIVRSGQPTMIQVALPSAEHGTAHTGAEDDEERLIHALDSWVQQICARYPKQRATWVAEPEQPAADTSSSAPQSRQVLRMIAILQAGMRKELDYLQEHNGKEDLLTSTLMQQIDFSSWHDETALWQHIKRIWMAEYPVHENASREEAETTFTGWDSESKLLKLELWLGILQAY
jgi:DNA segregation ATPase FtsK/SpoIIIE-like protein